YEHLKATDPKFRGDPAGLLHLLSVGRCVLLLDAFDEMGVAAAGRSVEDQFRELARLAGEEPLEPRLGNRMLITCRTHFFRDQQQVKDTASARPRGLAASEDSALGRLARRFNARIDELCLFDDDEVQDFLAKHLGDAQVDRAWEFIRETYDLKRLASRAVLLEMIVKSLPKLWREGRGAVTSAGLYEVYTRMWLEDRSGRNLETRPELRHRLLTQLAFSLWRRDDRQLHHRDLIEEVRGMSQHFPGLDFERVDVELRTAAFLVRSADGYYRFSHKSFLEYFLACGLWSALEDAENGVRALDLPPLSPEVGEFFWQLRDGKEHHEVRELRLEALREILTEGYRARASENALRLGHWSSGEKAFTVEGACLSGAELGGVDLAGVALPGADLKGANLEGANWERAVLRGARLDEAKLDRAQLAGVDLEQASLCKASMRRADLRSTCLGAARLDGALMTDVLLDQADLTGAQLVDADLTAASGDAATFAGADLTRSNLTASVWTGCDFTGAKLSDALLENWLPLDPLGMIPKGAKWLPGSDLRTALSTGHRSWARCTAWSPDGRFLASGSSDGSVRVWDAASGEERRVLSGSGGIVWSVCWSSGGEELASGSEDGSVRVWDAASGEERRVLSGSGGIVWSVCWSPGGEELAS
ncbi:MAG: pentapeptide repeat-containing protein, partial [Acidobacteriota bacterium]|nr:pentapeptide repeat-containing protein [Acidobacteriota bacterium]